MVCNNGAVNGEVLDFCAVCHTEKSRIILSASHIKMYGVKIAVEISSEILVHCSNHRGDRILGCAEGDVGGKLVIGSCA